jgi:hypothetical protein
MFLIKYCVRNINFKLNYLFLNKINNFILFLFKSKKIKLYKKIFILSLPTKIKYFTILRSPHIFKKSREQFQLSYIKTFYLINFFNYFNYLFKLFLIQILNIFSKNLIKNYCNFSLFDIKYKYFEFILFSKKKIKFIKKKLK